MLNKLLGVWKSDISDKETEQNFGNVSLEFKEGGDLLYSIYTGESVQKMMLTYTVLDDLIVTDQKSAPAKVETRYRFLPDGRLELENDGIKSLYFKL